MREHAVGDSLTVLRSGDRDRIARELYPLARRMVISVLRTSDPDLIETATSDTLLAVCRYHETFQGRSRVETWLYTIARREALRAAAASWRWLSLDDESAADLLAGLATWPDTAAPSDAWVELRTAVPRPEWRRIWLLANEPGVRRTLAELARRTGYTEGSVAVILSRVRKRLEATTMT